MSALPGPRSPFADEMLQAVADQMIELFGLARVEAEGRIASSIGSWDLDCAETDLYLGHEDPDYWAHWVYYGPVQWWRTLPDDLVPVPWP